jgi:2-polyprenyl-6-methoxyphenol hydroxylase-like FAD-dependent oxidoreductase
VGDAAGAVHPHSAQGANLALEDAAMLGESTDGTRPSRGAAYGRARQRKLRRHVLWSLLAAASLDAPNAGWQAIRWNRVPPMRRELLRRQAGLA